MDKVQFVVEDDKLWIDIPSFARENLCERHLVIDKDTFKKLYKEWILDEEEKPEYVKVCCKANIEVHNSNGVYSTIKEGDVLYISHSPIYKGDKYALIDRIHAYYPRHIILTKKQFREHFKEME